MAAGETELRLVLANLLSRWDKADQLAKQALVLGKDDERDEALRLRQEAEAEGWKLAAELGDLLLLQLRCAMDNTELRRHLVLQLMTLLIPEIARFLKRGLEETNAHAK